MKKIELEQLKEKLNVQHSIIHDCIDMFNDIKYLQEKNNPSDIEGKLIAHFPIQFRLMGKLMWTYLILELHKLFSQKEGNDKFNITSVLNTLKNCKYKQFQFKETLPKSSVESFLVLMSQTSGEFYIHYTKLNLVRDRYVAHLDRNIEDLEIKNDNIEYFMKLANRYLEEIIKPVVTSVIGNPITIKEFIEEIAEYKSIANRM
jgi:hypothetical protein